MRSRIRVGALGVVDEQHVAPAADLLHAVRETGKAAQSVLQGFAGDAERQRGARRASRVLCIVQAAQRTDAADRRDLAAHASGRAPDDFVIDIDAVRQRILHRDANHVLAGLLDPVSDVAAPAIIDADDRGALLLHPGDQTLLHGRIMFQRAMTIYVVFTDIDQDADAGIERWRQIDLIRRHLDDVDPAFARRLHILYRIKIK